MAEIQTNIIGLNIFYSSIKYKKGLGAAWRATLHSPKKGKKKYRNTKTQI